MPELPEVEVVRAGLAPAVDGARIVGVEVLDGRALKRHVPMVGDDGRGGHGVTLTSEAAAIRAADFERRLTGVVLGAPARRGKFMWIPVASERGASGLALLAHLGMSGQMLLRAHEAADDRHVRIRIWIDHPEHGELRLDFADQRLFGSLALDELVPTDDGAPGGFVGNGLLRAAGEASAGGAPVAPALIPAQAAHIARDPLDPAFDDVSWAARVRSRGTGVKALLLDQAVASGIGNIYADESLWRARLHPDTPGRAVGPRKVRELLGHVREVLGQALSEGGTSFDEQYVNVNGQAGYFAHSLNAYGRGGEACPRCGAEISRIPFGGRSSHFCPKCQRRASAPSS
ncbi:bifunctional DNA-formamidopyrimidine glycosylase/DNA-(apurinic or apyrimidinic site) lyase [Leucobacter sp. cx-42]|uniref:bifunctional DNA-formamidopyrimidine glycosylase/DNA-(apurinic or apyrimidinic site) lyase n=1 Tax=unclassified Leucobacter TaxID=2621730 RepID=UPI00165E2CDD|nr:bifunctional DNA-formamidopyrimidine glycosylase/DNA-(apurinic or apyrimidinic site) lyase [Leucobacter sp. cx-42]